LAQLIFRRYAIAAQIVRPRTPERLAQARAFAIEAAQLVANTRGHDVVVLDLQGLSPVTDFYVIATGTSARQMRSVAEQVRELGEQRSFPPMNTSGEEAGQWILVDFVDVVLHLFTPETRAFYDLDGLWADAPKVDWEAAAPPADGN
jgi:ribosome-associated protein